MISKKPNFARKSPGSGHQKFVCSGRGLRQINEKPKKGPVKRGNKIIETFIQKLFYKYLQYTSQQ